MLGRLVVALGLFALVACSGAKTDGPRVVMETSLGDITVELYPDKAPITVANFLQYVDAGALDGAHFYRTTRPDNDPMISVIQGGLWKPWEPGMDEEFEPPFPAIAHETTEVSGLSHEAGVISMARSEPGTASSEFFVNVDDNPSLDFGGERNPDGQGFAAFGRVISGMDVVRAIHAAETKMGEGFAGQIISEPVTIETVRRVK